MLMLLRIRGLQFGQSSPRNNARKKLSLSLVLHVAVLNLLKIVVVVIIILGTHRLNFCYCRSVIQHKSASLNCSWRANSGGSTKEYTVKRTVLEKFSTFADSKEQARANIQNCVIGPYEVCVVSETCVRKKPPAKDKG